MASVRSPEYRIPQFQHLLAISRSVAEIEREIAYKPASASDRRFVPIEEILERSNAHLHDIHLSFPVTIKRSRHNPGESYSTSVIPDAVYGIEYQEDTARVYRFFALEVERTSPLRRRSFKLTSTLKKLFAYQATIHSGSYMNALGVPNLFPHFVSRDEKHKFEMQNLASEVLSLEELKLFRFTCIP